MSRIKTKDKEILKKEERKQIGAMRRKKKEILKKRKKVMVGVMKLSTGKTLVILLYMAK